MELERKALYNLARMNWQRNPSLEVEPWQVEDYRSWRTPELFAALRPHGIEMDADQFTIYADEEDTPEDLASALVLEEVDPKEEDHLYLILFELWRRLLPERQTLSIFCDELDHQINKYDLDPEEDSTAIADAVANLEAVLDENTDEGVEPEEAFELLSSYCANDLRSFLYDYNADEIEVGHTLYATELIEGFGPYLGEDLWFHFLQARLWNTSDPEQASEGIAIILEELEQQPEMGLYLEILDYLSKEGDRSQFLQVANKTLPLIDSQDDLAALLEHCASYYHRLDQEKQAQTIEVLLEDLSAPLSSAIQSVKEILK